MTSTLTFAALSLTLATGGPALDGLVEPVDPVAIVGGSPAELCQFPAVVSILEDDETPVMCTGSLIHPQVVMTAAHCINPERPVVGLGFGEHGQATGVPEFAVPPIECVGNPEYYSGTGADVGYCLLSFPVVGVPIVPLMAGCEVDQVVPGTEVVIVGYGADYGTYDETTGEISATGVGPKRWTTQTVDFIDAAFEEITMYGPNGSQSACFGDSGGPVMMQLDDGSWRVMGTGGHLYDPGGLPGPAIPGNICGTGVAYGFSPFVNDWLEQQTGLDLTPCWDGESFVGGPDCADFPLQPDVGAGTWAAGCVGGPVGGGMAPACAGGPPPPPPPPPPPGTTDDGGSDDFGDSSDGGWPGGTTGVDPEPPPGGTGGSSPIPPGPAPGSTGEDDSSGGAPGLDGDMLGRGCSCRSVPSPRGLPAAAGLLLLGLVARRRRR
ncbi:MAG: trypsin-like serine protease [Nannocystaceae bacterium]